MIIPSPRYYRFLAVQKDYLLIYTKCTFVANFAKLIGKHLSAKTPMRRHRVLVLDEMNLRKAITVHVKDLTYAGLTNFEDDGPEYRDINDQPTHELVSIFQPLADLYLLFAVFTSKNSVTGAELEKISIKTITYMVNYGTRINGIIADSASTNKK